jgi:NitT/TauT family transport system substrate-binding protein
VQLVEPATGRGGTPVKIQVSGTVAEGPLYLATERGYFAEQGISPQFVTFDSAAQAIPALSTGQLDIGAGALSAGLFNAINRGIDIRVVAPQSENRGCAHSSTWVLVRKDLADSGAIRTAADLRGRKIALSSTANSSEYLADVLLRQGNVQSTEVEYVPMAFGDMGAAFAGGKIDLAVGAEPTATSFVERGLASKWLCGADIIPNIQFTFLFYSPQFADQHTDVAQRWMAAYLRAARDWQAMLETGQDRDAMLGVLGTYTPVKDLALLERISLPVPSAEARIDVGNISSQIGWMHERGYISQEPTPDRVVDTRFVEHAAAIDRTR